MWVYCSSVKNKLLISTTILIIVAISVQALGLTVAATDKPKGLTIKQLRSEININPGESKSGKVSVRNDSKDRIKINLNVEAFQVVNSEYDYELIEKSKIIDWVQLPITESILDPGQEKDFSYSVNIPNGAEPGGNYLSILVSTSNTPADAISSQKRLASLLYVNVLGDLTKTGKLLKISAPWLVGENSVWNMTLQNTGTAYFRSEFNIYLVDFFGNQIGQAQSGNPLLLHGTIRSINGRMPLPKYPGIYKIVFNVKLADSGDSRTTKYIFYLPVWFLMVISISVFWFAVVIISKRTKLLH